MAYLKSNLLDLQFILPKIATQANTIQKTIIFVNTIVEICPIIEVIQTLITLLSYSIGSNNQVRPYYLAMSDWDKELIAKAFKISDNKNTECMIFIATNVYRIGIDNLDIKLVIQ